MIKKIVASLFIAVLCVQAAPAQNLGGIAHEVLAETLTLPTQPSGSVEFRPCSSCGVRLLEVTANTKFEIGEIEVRMEDMRFELKRRPHSLLLLQLTPDRKHVARIKLSAASL